MTLQTIVVPVDGSTLALRAVGAAATVAASAQAKVRLLSVAHNESELAWAYDQAQSAAALLPDHYSRHHGPPCDPDQYLERVEQRVDGAGLTSCTTTAIADPVSVAAGLAEHLAHRPAFLLVLGGPRHRRHWPSTVLRDLLRTSHPPILVAQFHGRL